MIPQSNISRLSNRLAKGGGRRIPESVLERDYCIAWFLIGLSKSTLRQKLLFKGGTALKRCYFADYRFSEDLDFTLIEIISFDELKTELESIYAEVSRASGINIRFSREDSTRHQNSYTFYLSYIGPLPATSIPKEIKVDVTLKEHVSFPAEERVVLKSYDEYEDLPEDNTILCYSLQEILSEKTVALLDRARSEPRDLFDFWNLVCNEGITLSELTQSIEDKLQFRGKSLDDVRGEFNKKEGRLKKAWENRLATQMISLPEFEGIFRAVKRELRRCLSLRPAILVGAASIKS